MDDTKQLAEKWNRRYAEADGSGEPARVLTENIHLLTPGGKALDLACGRGANALIMAENGLDVTAWDLSPVAIERLRSDAEAAGLQVTAEARDVISQPPVAASFDFILVSHFLERSLVSAIIAALKPGGLLFYQTFSQSAVSDSGPANPDFRLADNELLTLFQPLRPRFYREERKLGDIARGCRDLAMLVAEKA
ncbi:MAG: methyltransferase domain-containing protein [Sedimenticola sp.]